jgi:hypothetical protein
MEAGAKTFGLTPQAPSNQKTWRRDYFGATKAALPFSKTQKPIFPNRNAASVAETKKPTGLRPPPCSRTVAAGRHLDSYKSSFRSPP